jgi:hypothetical protein
MQTGPTATPPRPHLPASLAYPARSDVLGMIVAYALAGLLTRWMSGSIRVEWLPHLAVSGKVTDGPLFVAACLIDAVLAVWAMKLAVEALLNTAHHRLGGQGAAERDASDVEAGVQVLVLALLALLAYLAALFGGTAAGVGVLSLAALALPAVIVLLAMDDGVLHAFNPLAWRALVARLGVSSYLAITACMAGLALAVFALQWALHWALPGWIATIGARFVGLYALVAAYHAAGHRLYVRHVPLGIDVAPPIVRPKYATYEESTAMEEAERLVVQGRLPEAVDGVHALMRRRGASAPVHERYREWLQALGDLPRLHQHAREYTGNLLALGHDKRALALVAESMRNEPGFLLDDPEAITRLVAYAAKVGHSQMAVQLATDFATRFPKHDGIVPNALTAARLMATKLGREAEARRILQALAHQHRLHPLAPEVEAALAEVQRMPGATPRL